ncbi:LysR family transcriptional regulator [Cupriavidus agavae]|uniref:LysR family transcriptional regulator n=1 Tax=Cupriavidus agavae TaxID=1001822 RepID=A0A4Q7S2G4_9BURK|nr:LysR family transcriptional regulator [Cupriavidus agavae]RZT39548.1 LysR family transcriptional regulator [Cupriavidus agavae]
MERLGDIALFLRVLDLGSISAAARSLDLSVAVASQRLQRLERELGVRLLHRTTRRLHATPEGAILAEQGRTLVEELEGLAGSLRQSGSGVTGTLRLTTSASFGRLYVSPLLPEFLRTHPGLSVSIHLNDNVLDLVSSGFDLAIRIGVLDDSSLVARKLAVNRRLLCASPEYLAEHGWPQTPEDLARHQCLVLVGAQGRADIWRFDDGKGGETAVRVRGRVEANTGELLSDAALAGFGIALHSTWHICEDLRAGRLVQVLPEYPVADSGIYAVMPQRKLVPQRVRAFVDFLAERWRDYPPGVPRPATPGSPALGLPRV